jgi:hypothetical protein
MPNLRQIFSAILPLAVGAGLLFALPHLPFLAKCEHALFLYQERFQKDTIYSDHGDRADLTLRTYSLTRDSTQIALASFEIDSETLKILGSEQPGPAQWAYLLHSIRKKKCDILAITAPLSWPDAEEIPLRTLQHEISQLPTLAIGLVGEKTGSGHPLPPYLQSSVIPGDLDHFDQLPEIDHIEQSPSVKAPVFGIASINGRTIDKADQSFLVPMLVRWGDNILPSLHLAALIASHRIPAAEVSIDPAGFLRLGEEGSIVAIDSQGRATLPNTGKSISSAVSLLTNSTQSQRSLILFDQNPPDAVSHLEQHHYALWPKKPSFKKSYQRWSLRIEIGCLFLIALLLQRRKIWLGVLAMAGLLIGFPSFSHWLPMLPFIGTFTTAFILATMFPEKNLIQGRRKNHLQVLP